MENEPLIQSAKELMIAHQLAGVGKILAVTNAGIPYHSAEHCLSVAGMAAKLAPCEGVDIWLALAAGLLHDLGHSGGEACDSANIERAVAFTESLFGLRRGIIPLDDYELEQVITAIRETEYDGGRFVHEPSTPLSRVLRDADLCMPFLTHEWFARMTYGLMQEMNFSGSMQTFFDRQCSFYRDVTWYSLLGKKMSVDVPKLLKTAQSSVFQPMEEE